jgi:uncharacterized protein (DUF58 family)
MYAALKNRLLDWLLRPQLEPGAIVLGQRRVYILPTRQGLLFALVLFVMLVGSINYALGLGFVLTFLLGALAVVAMLHTWRNLVGLRVSAGRAQPVFAGDTARFTLHLDNVGGTERYAIGLAHAESRPAFVDLPARSVAPATVGVPARRRGVLRPGRMTLFTRFPLGLFRAWAYVEPGLRCLIYPRPAQPGLPLPPATASSGAGAEHGTGQEDFHGLRQYHVGDSPRHVAWKAAARDRGLLTKQFSGQADRELWLDWDLLPDRMGTEERLSHLARWVIEAHARGLSYGLRLPDRTVEMAAGDTQRERCLEALALHDLTDSGTESEPGDAR